MIHNIVVKIGYVVHGFVQIKAIYQRYFML